MKFNSKIKNDICKHLKKIFPESEQEILKWSVGGIVNSIPDFIVCRLKQSNENKSWIYVSMGASKFLNKISEHIEFVLLAPFEDERLVEVLAMVSHYHSNSEYRLQLGSIINIGQGWVDGSDCDHLLVSLPYFKGQDFEQCLIEKHLVRLLWLIPITDKEHSFARDNGVEALEEIFESKNTRITDPFRDSEIK